MYTPVNPYVVLAEVIEELKMKPAEVAANAALTDELLRAIDRASRWVDTYTQRDYFYHDFSVNPIVFDQYSEKVYGFEIFFPFTPLIGISKAVLGGDPTATELEFNRDYFYDKNRMYLLRASRMFVQNVDIPHDGASVLGGNSRGGWCLSRPDRMLFVYGTAGNPQARAYQMTATGDAAAQTNAWQISAYAAPTTLYWTLTKVGSVVMVKLTSDSFGAQIVARGTGTAGTPQVVRLAAVDGSGISGQVSINYTADSATANTLAITPATATPVDASSVPQGVDAKITTSTRLVAASFSGHNRKEIVGLDGETTDITDRSIPKTVYQLLGRQSPILV